MDVVERCRLGSEVGRFRQDLLGIAALPRRRHPKDRVALAQRPATGACLRDRAGKVATKREWELVLLHEPALPDLVIDRIDACGPHRDQHLALPWLWNRQVFEREHFWATEAMDANSLHGIVLS